MKKKIRITVDCGIHIFVKKEIISYLFLRTQFVFIDFSQPLVLVLLDYLSIIVFLATAVALHRFSQIRVTIQYIGEGLEFIRIHFCEVDL